MDISYYIFYFSPDVLQTKKKRVAASFTSFIPSSVVRLSHPGELRRKLPTGSRWHALPLSLSTQVNMDGGPKVN